MRALRRPSFLVAALVAAAVLVAPAAQANHSWGNYHWARRANPLQLQVGDNVTSQWDGILNTTIADWSQSTVVDLTKVTGQANPKNCRPTAGRVEVCNSTYGNNGWLGIAQIWLSREHITQGVVKVNDTYYNTPTYNTTAWRNLVMCQEVGHTLGLDHQDENFNNANLGTCMDYTNSPGTNQRPNQHDYEQLLTIYSHLDSTNTAFASVGSAAAEAAGANGQADWGQAIRIAADGRPVLFERALAGGARVFTFVVWA